MPPTIDVDEPTLRYLRELTDRAQATAIGGEAVALGNVRAAIAAHLGPVPALEPAAIAVAELPHSEFDDQLAPLDPFDSEELRELEASAGEPPPPPAPGAPSGALGGQGCRSRFTVAESGQLGPPCVMHDGHDGGWHQGADGSRWPG